MLSLDLMSAKDPQTALMSAAQPVCTALCPLYNVDHGSLDLGPFASAGIIH